MRQQQRVEQQLEQPHQQRHRAVVLQAVDQSQHLAQPQDLERARPRRDLHVDELQQVQRADAEQVDDEPGRAAVVAADGRGLGDEAAVDGEHGAQRDQHVGDAAQVADCVQAEEAEHVRLQRDVRLDPERPAVRHADGVVHCQADDQRAPARQQPVGRPGQAVVGRHVLQRPPRRPPIAHAAGALELRPGAERPRGPQLDGQLLLLLLLLLRLRQLRHLRLLPHQVALGRGAHEGGHAVGVEVEVGGDVGQRRSDDGMMPRGSGSRGQHQRRLRRRRRRRGVGRHGGGCRPEGMEPQRCRRRRCCC